MSLNSLAHIISNLSDKDSSIIFKSSPDSP